MMDRRMADAMCMHCACVERQKTLDDKTRVSSRLSEQQVKDHDSLSLSVCFPGLGWATSTGYPGQSAKVD